MRVNQRSDEKLDAHGGTGEDDGEGDLDLRPADGLWDGDVEELGGEAEGRGNDHEG